jgi:hypothetical protein
LVSVQNEKPEGSSCCVGKAQHSHKPVDRLLERNKTWKSSFTNEVMAYFNWEVLKKLKDLFENKIE